MGGEASETTQCPTRPTRKPCQCLYGTTLQGYLRSRHVLLRAHTSSVLMHHPDLLPSNPPSLSEQLRCRTDELLSRMARANSNTQFARTAPELTEFRDATAGRVGGMDDRILSKPFRKTVHLTTYDSYATCLRGHPNAASRSPNERDFN
jgi:hypothetical protein